MSETLVTLQEHDGILTVVMDAPKNNLMTGAFHDALDAVLEQVQNRAVQGGIKAMIVCGGGRHFSVGADVDSLKDRSAHELYDDTTGKLPESHIVRKRCLTVLRELPFPVIAVVRGFCIGSGSEIAINCHYRIVETGARIGQPEATFGILPALGGIARTIELCGMQTAYELVMTGKLISAEEACEIGWGDILVGKKQGMETALALAAWFDGRTFQPEQYRQLIQEFKQR